MTETKDAAHGNLFLDRAAIRISQGSLTIPKGAHLCGVGKKEQRLYEHIKESALQEGRYGERAKEVAARTVLKLHKEKGLKRGQ